MNKVKIEESDFLKLGRDLMEVGKSGRPRYVEEAEALENDGRKRVIEDRETNEPYLERYYYMNFRPFARIVIHKFLRSDVDGLHDHPWPFETFILSGGYWEFIESDFLGEGPVKIWRAPGYHGMKKASHFHRLELDRDKAGEDTWTLFLMGPKVGKDWGFLDKEGNWIQWEEYLNKRKNKL